MSGKENKFKVIQTPAPKVAPLRKQFQVKDDTHMTSMKNCLIFKTPYPLSIYIQNFSNPLIVDLQF